MLGRQVFFRHYRSKASGVHRGYRVIRRRCARFYPGESADILKFVFAGSGRRKEHVRLFERSLADFLGAENVVAVSSGREAMRLILSSLQLEAGDEVVLPAYTLKDLVPIIKGLGLVPVFADCEPSSFNISPDSFRERISPSTKAVIAAHMFGVPCRIKEVCGIARSEGIKVIEDCAHTMGAEYEGRKTGTFGDGAFFSFELSKPVNALGGGAIVLKDPAVSCSLRERAASRSAHIGRVLSKAIFASFQESVSRSPFFPVLTAFFTSERGRRLYWKIQARRRSRSFGFDGVQAGIALKQLEALGRREEARALAARRYDSIIPPAAGVQRVPPGASRNYYFYVVTLPGEVSAAEVRDSLRRKGIDSGIGEEITDDCAALWPGRPCPCASSLFRRNIQLPMYDGLSEEQAERIAYALLGAVREGR
ncbi:MAG: aminotransferase class I/II-fold pyridoxal phosphate-dependent enzyme [Candidatus Omnitrophica bacterium]|nr:aminotransferase class I/II-fold pyridoxal phosphate-dependent enzyme [Candidatus Omnitrophota bacterium]